MGSQDPGDGSPQEGIDVGGLERTLEPTVLTVGAKPECGVYGTSAQEKWAPSPSPKPRLFRFAIAVL